MKSCCRRNPKPCTSCRRNPGYGVADTMDPLVAYNQGIITADRYYELTGEHAPGTPADRTGGLTEKSWFWPGVAGATIGGLAMFADKKGK